MQACQGGNHTFVTILQIEIDECEYKTVRWCERCGSIVIDHKIDGITIPGYYMKLRHPLIMN